MKILMMLFVGMLAAAMGCQASDPPVATAPQNTQTVEKPAESPKVADTDDHGHEENAEKSAPRINLEDAKEAFDAGDAVFVDTRSASFFQNEHVKGAINVPSSDFDNTYKSVPKDKKIIVYCS